MKKLELKHLAAYLPYGLNMYVEHADGTQMKSWELRPESIQSVLNYQNKPILRSLNNLRDEIEANGEKFYPLGKLHFKEYRMRGTKGKVDYVVSEERGANYHYITTRKNSMSSAQGVEIDLDKINKNEYWIIRNLLEWHFDIFNLIENNLAIDFNTLNK